MAALVQSYQQQSATSTMLQSRSNPSSTQTSTNQAYGHGHGNSQQHAGSRVMTGTTAATGSPAVYRGAAVPIQPYAFTSTPSLTPSEQWQQFRTSARAPPTLEAPGTQTLDNGTAPGRPRYSASVSMTNLPSTLSMALPAGGTSRDDSSLPNLGTRRTLAARPQSTYQAATSSSVTPTAPIRAFPGRYRRTAARAESFGSTPSATGMATIAHLYNPGRPVLTRNPQSTSSRPVSFVGPMGGSAVDDMQLHYGQSFADLKKLRRRSMPVLEPVAFSISGSNNGKDSMKESSLEATASSQGAAEKESRVARTSGATDVAALSPDAAADGATGATHRRTGSSDSRNSSRSNTSTSRPSSSTNRTTPTVSSPPTGTPTQLGLATDLDPNVHNSKLAGIPARSSSSDAVTSKHSSKIAPHSQSAAMDSEARASATADDLATTTTPITSPSGPVSPAKSISAPRIESPAAKQLAAINERNGKPKSKTSRLRRAFSFGSAAELRKAATPGSDNIDGAQNASGKLHKQPTEEELYDAEQARVAQQQEEAGIGHSIYSGSRLFAASTDNISISSTASSASIMIRKMGRGMKKGGRSLAGLFRPKSVIGSPSADAKIPEASQVAVSMITAEAERERVNVNPDPHTQHGGGTGFPRLERNSIDAANSADRRDSSGTDRSATRKSIVGGEKERAEVLAAVRKGILKHSNSSHGGSVTAVRQAATFDLPEVPHVTESPISSAPSTPGEDAQGQGHKRTGSVAIGSEDYFMSALRLRQETKSAPSTPQGNLKRNATFSPRIVFHDTWPSQEYDRRGEIATCNRLTPMLAQQIKEELNTFKMEMEVHENSKIYTHFF